MTIRQNICGVSFYVSILGRGVNLITELPETAPVLPVSDSELAAIKAASSENELRRLLLNFSQKPFQVPA